MKTKSRLTPLQSRFIDEYLVDLNGTQAAKRAGYNGKRPEVYASKLLATPHIVEEVQRRKDARRERTEITQDYVLQKIVGALERCEAIRDNDGVFRGAQLLGSHLGLWKSKHELAGPGGGPIPVNATTTDPVEAARAYREMIGGADV